MERNIIEEMLKPPSKDPSYFLEYLNVGRGLIEENVEKMFTPGEIQKTQSVRVWKIVGNNLEPVVENIGMFSEKESYIIAWKMMMVSEIMLLEEFEVFYHWKGNSAVKGASPLPPEASDEHTVVERLCQWSETPVFLRIFNGKMVVLQNELELDLSKSSTPHLFISRGEFKSELHLFEVPCKMESLRSRTSFVLIIPKEKQIVYWHGSKSLPEYRKKLVSNEAMKNYLSNWDDFKISEINEGFENEIFLNTLIGENSHYYSLVNCEKKYCFTPKLFYLNSITGSFTATEIINVLACKDYVSPFPFLQSHLYTAIQPALFLLDNEHELFLWEGWRSNDEDYSFPKEFPLAKEIAIKYAKENSKYRRSDIIIKHVFAGLEPKEFINIFPQWIPRDDIKEKHIKAGLDNTVKIIVP